MHTKRDTYQIITDTILQALETCGPCERPWVGPSLTMPVNAVSGHEYRGTNVVMLWVAANEAGYAENQWATFKQWSENGASVRKGEKGTPVIWFKMLERQRDEVGDIDAEDENGGRIPYARLSWVFNVAQLDGYQPEKARAHHCEWRENPPRRRKCLLPALHRRNRGAAATPVHRHVHQQRHRGILRRRPARADPLEWTTAQA